MKLVVCLFGSARMVSFCDSELSRQVRGSVHVKASPAMYVLSRMRTYFW